jgi:hypothetical protein
VSVDADLALALFLVATLLDASLKYRKSQRAQHGFTTPNSL